MGILLLENRGEYDEVYVTYVYEVLKEADETGLKVFVDIHQDCVSSGLLIANPFLLYTLLR